MSDTFLLPEIGGLAFFSLQFGRIFMNGSSTLGIDRKVVSVVYTKDQVQNYTFVVTFYGARDRGAFTLPMNRAVEFGFWLNWFGCPAVPDEAPATAPAPVAAVATPRTCPVCYGTGFHKGFGAPCSQGCSS